MNKTTPLKYYVPCNDIMEEVIHMLGGYTYAAKKINEYNLGRPISPNMLRAWVECEKIPYKYCHVLEAFARANKPLFLKAFEYEGYIEGGGGSRRKYIQSDFVEYVKLLTTPIPCVRVRWESQFKKPIELEHWLRIQGGVKSIVRNLNEVKAVGNIKLPERNFSYSTIYSYFYYGYMPTVWREYFENEMGMPKNVGFDKKESIGDTEEEEPTEEVEEMITEVAFLLSTPPYGAKTVAKQSKPTEFLPAKTVVSNDQQEETFSILD